MPEIKPELFDIDDMTTLIGVDELSNVAGTGSFNTAEGRSLDNGRIEAAIGFADDLMKSFLAKRYPLVRDLTPADTPRLLKGFGADIVRHRLRGASGDGNSVSDEVENRHKAAIAWLKDVARGLSDVDFSDVENGSGLSDAASSSPAGRVQATFVPSHLSDIMTGYRQ